MKKNNELSWTTVQRRVADCVPLDYNPRILTPERRQKLEDSLKKFNLVEIPVINTDGIVIAGNQRIDVLMALGKADDIIDVRLPSRPLTEREVKEYNITSNTHVGIWDTQVLEDVFSDIDLGALGLMPDDIPGSMPDNTLDSTKKEAQEDDYEIPDEIKTDIVTGDLFEIGPHRLLCGDSTSADDVGRLMNGERAEMLFTSPPYVEMRKYNGGKDLSLDKLIKFIPAFAANCQYLCINLGLQFKDSEVVTYWEDYLEEAKRIGLKLVAWNVWDKTMGGTIASATNMFLLTHEWIFVFGKDRKRLNRTIPNQLDKYESRHGKDWMNGINKSFRKETDEMEDTTSATYTHHQLHSVVQQTPELGSIRSLHPATFPVGLPFKYIEAMTNDSDIICESFTGSGTTMVASHQLNRSCYGMEIDPKYCQVIVDRMLKLDPTLEIKRNGQPYTPPSL